MAFKKERLLKVCYRSEARQSRSGWYGGSSYVTVPSLNLKGKWL